MIATITKNIYLRITNISGKKVHISKMTKRMLRSVHLSSFCGTIEYVMGKKEAMIIRSVFLVMR